MRSSNRSSAVHTRGEPGPTTTPRVPLRTTKVGGQTFALIVTAPGTAIRCGDRYLPMFAGAGRHTRSTVRTTSTPRSATVGSEHPVSVVALTTMI